MPCNLYRTKRQTLREAKLASGEFDAEWKREAWTRPAGMSDAQYERWCARRKREWDAKHDEVIGGHQVFACGSLVVPVCSCGYASDYLCDYPIGEGKTCDLALCDNCRRRIGEDMDLCAIHHAEFSSKATVSTINPWPPARHR